MLRHSNTVKMRVTAVTALLTGFCVSFSSAPQAAVFPDLYTVTVVPSPEAEDRRIEAIRLGMAKTLIRVTGRKQAATFPDMVQLIERAPDYMNSYAPLQRGEVRVGFIPSNIESELVARNWPVWGAERPMTLLWIAVDGGNGERTILPASSTEDAWSPEMAELMELLTDEVERVADERGLPYTLPLLDLLDLEAISFADIWRGFDARIGAASQRYRADASLVGLVRVSKYGLDIRWTLLQGARRRTVLTNTISEGIDWLADQYAAEFSTVGPSRATPITVLNIGSIEDYGQVLSYFEALSVVDSVDVDGLDGDVLSLRVRARADESALRRVLALDGVLTPSRTATDQTPFANTLVFELVRSGFEP